jgi:hypothetical protein
MEGKDNRVQQKVDSLLKTGIVLSILWLAGIGSLIALVSGLRAKRLIAQSEGAAIGMGRVWWCVVVGGLGVAIWLPIILVSVINNLNK